MGGEFLGRMLRSSLYLGGGPVVALCQGGLEFVVLELRPLPSPPHGPSRTPVHTGELDGAGGVVCALYLSGTQSPRGQLQEPETDR
jgi:hypothetical protein